MMLYEIAFYGFGALTVGAALFICFTRNVMYAAFSLLLTFLGLAALFVLLGSDFVAVTQVLVYVGGVLILLIFGIMLTQRTERQSNQEKNQVLTSHLNRFKGAALAAVIFIFLYQLIDQSLFVQNNPPQTSTVRPIGQALMTQYSLVFEAIGVLLLVGLIGATYIAADTQKR
jgi:NADH-quinone oxidoreductase subunit J